MMKLDELENEIIKRIPNIVMKRIYFSKIDRTLLCVYNEGLKRAIRLFDENYGFVASIDYSINSASCFISTFETLEDLQGLGLGRYIYNMALAHADMLGVTSSSGMLAPTNNIKGVSKPNEDNTNAEIEALKLIYTKLGNSLDNSLDANSIKFSSSWNAGDRIKLLSCEQQDFVQEVVNLNKNKGLHST